MTEYADLSRYEYWDSADEESPPAKTLNVGWLGDALPSVPEEPDPVLVSALVRLAQSHRVRQTRGSHGCRLCPTRDRGIRVETEESPTGSVHLGSAEIEVRGTDGTVYAAPTLIAHYVAAHHYRPPGAFVEAAVAAAEGAGPYHSLVPGPFPEMGTATDRHGDEHTHVGWLTPGMPFDTAAPDARLVDALRALWTTHWSWRSGGTYLCPVCLERAIPPDPAGFGMSAITLPRDRGAPFHVPWTIFHLIEAHRYRPPAEFTATVFAATGSLR
ncbi:hypothetical protein JOD54_006073 [Actinokineospora baliensis]|uniref:DUF7919 family protein n=1 Tax=Actinokineospora baliensis TaxID=547056 RepID=UPI00195AC7A6|nr:hypothetical protein [Actinokineospora baliensis]MBM7775869.1 hypothetical protein [Actinokineospora baliensis]